MMFYKSTTISMYLASKLVEVSKHYYACISPYIRAFLAGLATNIYPNLEEQVNLIQVFTKSVLPFLLLSLCVLFSNIYKCRKNKVTNPYVPIIQLQGLTAFEQSHSISTAPTPQILNYFEANTRHYITSSNSG